MKNSIYFSAIFITLSLASCNPDESPEETPIIDLEATEISFTIDKETQFTGTATLTGILTNIGEAYSSNANQQGLQLYQSGNGQSGGGDLVAMQTFQNLMPGETVTVSYTRPWNTSSPAEGEFPPSYTLRISYDPDIFIDGNPNNDDSDLDNNVVVKSGSGINELFRELFLKGSEKTK